MLLRYQQQLFQNHIYLLNNNVYYCTGQYIGKAEQQIMQILVNGNLLWLVMALIHKALVMTHNL